MRIIFLKYIEGSDIGITIENQFKNRKDYIYNKVSCIVEEAFADQDNKSLYIVILGIKKQEIYKTWLGKCRKYKQHKLVIENAHEINKEFNDLILGLYKQYSERTIYDADFLSLIDTNDNEFINFVNQVNKKYESDFTKTNLKSITYKPIANSTLSGKEENLSKLAQLSIYAEREYSISQDTNRTEFQRDRDRIVYSKAFRRLVGKAQIFTSVKGDHYRTRLTHTLELTQVSRDVARALNLNEDLAEAIALGHDLGHTPFGHEGERELNDILHGKIKMSDKLPVMNYGGFKHNYQSLRIVTLLEEKYPEYPGLNLTYQTMEGIFKHTKYKTCTECSSNCNDICFDLKEFFFYPQEKLLFLENTYPTTLEGQIVFWGDEIAQRGHDLDDGIASGIIDLNELLKEMSQDPQLIPLYNSLKDSLDDRRFVTNHYIDLYDLKRAVVVTEVSKYFINDLIKTSKGKMDDYEKNNNIPEGRVIIRELIIQLSTDAQNALEALERLITSKVVNSQEVNCFDGKSAYTVRKLFKAYYSNPRQLPDSALKRIELEIKSFSPNYVDIRTGAKDKVREEIEIWQGINSNNALFENKRKHLVFMRCVTDLIAGMTDSYANEQFRKLYIP